MSLDIKGALAFFFIISFFATPAFSQYTSNTPSSDEKLETFPFVAQVERTSVNVRAGQSVNYEQVGQLEKGEKVVVLGKNYSWYEIRLHPYMDSYISAEFIKPLRDGIAETTADRVNVRARPDLKATVLGQVSQGTLIRILSKTDGWYKIQTPQTTRGWIATNLVTFVSRDIPAPRIVQLPTQNIYEKHKQIQQAKAEVEKKAEEKAQAVVQQRAKRMELEATKERAKIDVERVSIVGVVKDLGDQALSERIRHQLKVDDKTTYYLKGYRRIIDEFRENKVKIEGIVQSSIKSDHPVLLVTRINLVL